MALYAMSVREPQSLQTTWRHGAHKLTMEDARLPDTVSGRRKFRRLLSRIWKFNVEEGGAKIKNVESIGNGYFLVHFRGILEEADEPVIYKGMRPYAKYSPWYRKFQVVGKKDEEWEEVRKCVSKQTPMDDCFKSLADCYKLPRPRSVLYKIYFGDLLLPGQESATRLGCFDWWRESRFKKATKYKKTDWREIFEIRDRYEKKTGGIAPTLKVCSWSIQDKFAKIKVGDYSVTLSRGDVWRCASSKEWVQHATLYVAERIFALSHEFGTFAEAWKAVNGNHRRTSFSAASKAAWLDPEKRRNRIRAMKVSVRAYFKNRKRLNRQSRSGRGKILQLRQLGLVVG